MAQVLEQSWKSQPQGNAALRPEIAQNLSVLTVGSRQDFIGCGSVTESGGITRNPSKVGQAWEGDGTDNIAWAVPKNDGSLLAAGEHYFTLIVVFRKRAAGASTGHIAGYGSSAGSGGNTLHRLVGGSTADQIQFQLQTSTGALLYNTASASAGINDQQWHCAVVPYQSTTTTANDSLVYWIDGVQRGSVARSVGTANTTFDRASVGSGLRGGSLISAGNWDVALYAHLLTRMPDAWCAKASQLSSVWDAVFQPRRIWVPQSSVVSGYSITAQPGSYSITGQSSAITRSKHIVADVGSYSLSGQNATINYTPTGTNYTITANHGTYSITGQVATLLRSKQIVADAGSYSLTGQNATINYSGSGTTTLKAGSWIRYRIIT